MLGDRTAARAPQVEAHVERRGPRDPLDHADRLLGELDQLEGLVVGLVHRRPQAVGIKSVAAGALVGRQQFPGELDGVFLEVVAETEVAVHLEERAVTARLADLFDVTRAHALLHAGRARERRRGLTEEVRLERHHAGVDEQQVGIVEDQRGTGHLGVSGLDEVIQEALPDLMRLHWVLVLGGRGACTSVVTVGTRARANPTICDIPAYRRATRTPELRRQQHEKAVLDSGVVAVWSTVTDRDRHAAADRATMDR